MDGAAIWAWLKGLLDLFDDIGAVIGFAAGLVVLAWYVALALKSYRLLRRMFYGSARGKFWPVVGTLVSVYRSSWSLRNPLSLLAWGLFDNVRRRVEHEVFDPRPALEGPNDSRAAFRAKLKAWRQRMARIARDPLIGDESQDGRTSGDRRFLTAGAVNDRFGEIGRYFAVLKGLGLDEEELKFQCLLKIRHGFIAPLHLIAGLLQKFETETEQSDWVRIIKSFNRDVSRESCPVANWPVDPAPGGAMPFEGFRRTQKFIFDCWLQWGPSVPVGNPASSRWGGALTALQFGYGDEANSIEIVGERAFLAGRLRELWPKEGGVLAVSAEVTGRLAHSRVLGKAQQDVGATLKTSWHLLPEDRFDPNDKDASIEEFLDNGRILLQVDQAPVAGKPAITNATDVEHYYSAYLWVMFAVLQKTPNGLYMPLYNSVRQAGETAKPWLDLLPFFEHGNIACPITLSFLKGQLARKAVGGVAQLVRDAGGAGRFPLRFAFACAIDHTGDGHGLWLDTVLGASAGGPTTTDLKEEMRALAPAYPELFGGEDPIIRLDHYGAADCFHSAGDLPRHIRTTYTHITETTERSS